MCTFETTFQSLKLFPFFFTRTYDPERDYARMKSAGVFKSLGKDIFTFRKYDETCYLISEGRERPEWLSEYESELDDAIASLKNTVGSKL
jgi:hypothetical protein